MNNCFIMLSHLKIHVILFMEIVVVMLLCSMLEINDDVLNFIVLGQNPCPCAFARWQNPCPGAFTHLMGTGHFSTKAE